MARAAEKRRREAQALARRGDLSRALDLAEAARRLDDADPASHVLLGRLRRLAGKPASERRAGLEAAWRRFPDCADLAYELARACQAEAGDEADPRAVKLLRRCVELAPEQGPAHLALSRALQRDSPSEAMAHFARSQRIARERALRREREAEARARLPAALRRPIPRPRWLPGAAATIAGLAILVAGIRWLAAVRRPTVPAAPAAAVSGSPRPQGTATTAVAIPVTSGAAATATQPAPAIESPPPPAPAIESAAALVETWRAAWERRDLAAYGACYSERFHAEGLDRRQWLERKAAVFATSGPLAIQLEDIEVRADGNELRITFTQWYRSGRRTDRGHKTLRLTTEGTALRIVGEQWSEAG